MILGRVQSVFRARGATFDERRALRGLEGLGCGWFVVAAAAMEAGFACAPAGVAEGFVEGAVVAEGRVGDDARDDQFGFGLEGLVGAVALGDGVRSLRIEVFESPTRVERRRRHGLELRERHPAETLVGSQRAPGVSHLVDLLFHVSRTGRHVRFPFCAPEGACWGL